MSTPTYSFPGLWSFVNRGADNRDVHHMGRARETWHFREVQESLAQVPKLDDRELQRLHVKHALEVRESLDMVLRGMADAISEVAEKFDLYDQE